MENVYQKKDIPDHIRTRMEMYLGANILSNEKVFGMFDDGLQVVKMMYSKPLVGYVYELINNATDHSIRTGKVTYINVTFDEDTIEVENDGPGIDIKMTNYGVYVPELLLGDMFTSSNFEDDKTRFTSGKNGCGAFIVNALSSTFIIDDICSGKYYHQEFANGKKKSEPVITDTTDTDCVKITATLDKKSIPDNFGNIAPIIIRRLYEIAFIFPSLSVYCNGNEIQVKTMKNFIGTINANKKKSIILNDSTETLGTKIALFVTNDVPIHLSYVNGNATENGGTHVGSLLSKLSEKIKNSMKISKEFIKTFKSILKSNISYIISVFVDKPIFTSQHKEELATKMNIQVTFTPELESFIKKNVITRIKASFNIKTIKKIEGARKGKSLKHTDIEKYIAAEKVGPGSNCVLVLTEGDSAQGAIQNGLAKVMPNSDDYYGVYTIGGKGIKNPRKKPSPTNKFYMDLKEILGLNIGQKFTSPEDVVKKLNYGQVLIVTDADYDGIDIRSQVLNMFSYHWPSLLQFDFFHSLRTPCVKAFTPDKKKMLGSFHTFDQYEKWLNKNKNTKHYAKYYKGLATNTKQEFVDILKNKNNYVSFSCENLEETLKWFDAAFAKDTKMRKEWVQYFMKTRNSFINTMIDFDSIELEYFRYLNDYHILFADYKNRSSIPFIDGLKPTQRKIIDCVLELKLKKEIKVCDLGGKVSEKKIYNHGPASIEQTIVNMAQDYVGSNNLPLLFPEGEFGSRLLPEAGSSRYIHTYPQPYLKYIFREEDLPVLPRLVEEERPVEPQFFVPVIPIILVNGAEGMGYGFSTFIPQYKLGDILEYILNYLDQDKDQVRVSRKTLVPYNRGIGYMKVTEKNCQYESWADYERDEEAIYINETPVTIFYNDYRLKLEGMIKTGEIVDFSRDSNKKPIFFIKMSPSMCKLPMEKIIDKLNLVVRKTMTNLTYFDTKGALVTKKNPMDIMDEYIQFRLKYYGLRKEYILKKTDAELLELRNKMEFIKGIIEKKIIVSNTAKTKVHEQLDNYPDFKFTKLPSSSEKSKAKKKIEKATVSYNYLTDMRILSLTKEKYEKILKELQEKTEFRDNYEKLTLNDLWKNDLEELIEHIPEEYL